MEAERGEGDGVCPRSAAASVELGMARVMFGELVEIDLDGGKELRSGAMVDVGLLLWSAIGGGGCWPRARGIVGWWRKGKESEGVHRSSGTNE